MNPDETRDEVEAEEGRRLPPELPADEADAPEAPPVEADEEAHEPAPPARDLSAVGGLDVITLDASEDDLDDDDDYEDGDLDDDEEYEEEEEVRLVLITGASGNLGRKLASAWHDPYDLVLLDKVSNPDDPDVIEADLSVLDESWIRHFHGVDTVVHLAAEPNEFSTWEELEQPNLDVLCNVFHAAALAGVERLIFASSNHVMGLYREIGDMPITTALPPRPDSPYGATKLVGERLGKSLANAFDITFIALRLGWIQPGDNRPETLPDAWARSMWLSNPDLVRLFDAAVEAELDDRIFAVVNGMSNNQGMRWDVSTAADLLGFYPEDDAYAEEL